jgi:hypothetical protein
MDSQAYSFRMKKVALKNALLLASVVFVADCFVRCDSVNHVTNQPALRSPERGSSDVVADSVVFTAETRWSASISEGDCAGGRLTVGTHHLCALCSGRVWCAGSNYHGQLGNPVVDQEPAEFIRFRFGRGNAFVPVVLGGRVESIASRGEQHLCAFAGSQRRGCWLVLG